MVKILDSSTVLFLTQMIIVMMKEGEKCQREEGNFLQEGLNRLIILMNRECVPVFVCYSRNKFCQFVSRAEERTL